jgi:hypothetical protein
MFVFVFVSGILVPWSLSALFISLSARARFEGTLIQDNSVKKDVPFVPAELLG